MSLRRFLAFVHHCYTEHTFAALCFTFACILAGLLAAWLV